MHWTRLVWLIIGLLATAACGEDQSQNPLKKSKVGDWLQYTSTEGEQRQTVIKKTDSDISIETLTKAKGQESKSTRTMKLDEKFDPLSLGANSTAKELNKGEEKLTINGKPIATKWIEYEITSKMRDMTVTANVKVWMAPDDIPIGGLVKMESDMGVGGKAKMELKDYGYGK